MDLSKSLISLSVIADFSDLSKIVNRVISMLSSAIVILYVITLAPPQFNEIFRYGTIFLGESLYFLTKL